MSTFGSLDPTARLASAECEMDYLKRQQFKPNNLLWRQPCQILKLQFVKKVLISLSNEMETDQFLDHSDVAIDQF